MIHTYSGKLLEIANPKVELIDPMDILQHLSGIMRFNGATRHLWSVAHHTCAILDYLGPDAGGAIRQAALIHDFPEYVLGDIISPVKQHIAPPDSVYEMLTTLWENAICNRFNLGLGSSYRTMFNHHVKHIDRAIRLAELAVIHPTHPHASHCTDQRMIQAVETYLPCTRQEIIEILGYHIVNLTGVKV